MIQDILNISYQKGPINRKHFFLWERISLTKIILFIT